MMTDAMNAIRDRAENESAEDPLRAINAILDRRALLAHIDTLTTDAELLANVILGGSSYPQHREAAERILAILGEHR